MDQLASTTLNIYPIYFIGFYNSLLLKGIDIQAWLVYLEGFSISIVLEASGAI
jgi:hypothetical protein